MAWNWTDALIGGTMAAGATSSVPWLAPTAGVAGFLYGGLRSDKQKAMDYNSLGNTIFNTTGYNPLNTAKQPDYYGKNIKRQYATDLNGAGQAQYTAAQNQIAEKYKAARINSLQEAQARGLQSSGFAQSQSNAWTEKQINEEAQIYADLLQQEQETLDTFYVQDKQLAYNLAIRERQETLARQQMFQDYLLTFVDLAEALGKFAGAGAPIA